MLQGEIKTSCISRCRDSCCCCFVGPGLENGVLATVAEICADLERRFPPQLAEAWDNTGLLIGARSRHVDRLLTCLTLTQEVAAEAVQSGCQMIVSHHPVLFRAVQRLTEDTVEGRILLQLIEAGISVYSPHTSFDSAAAGINQMLAQSFGLEQVVPLQPAESVPQLGSGRSGKLSPALELDDFLRLVAKVTGTQWLKVCRGGPDQVRHVAIGCGAAEGFLETAIARGCDCFVTGEARFHTLLAARAAGVNLVLTGHYGSERPAIERLAVQLGEQFPGVSCTASEAETNPVEFFSV